MTTIEKKKIIKKAIDTLPDEHLDEALVLIEALRNIDSKREEFVRELLGTEESLFKRLAQ